MVRQAHYERRMSPSFIEGLHMKGSKPCIG
jgi:hypothetical protein